MRSAPEPTPVGRCRPRIGVYTDYVYRRDAAGGISAERAFTLFLAEMAGLAGDLVVLGRLHPEPGRSRYRLPPAVEFVALPYYATLSRPGAALGALARSLRLADARLGGLDGLWLLGPHPFALALAGLAAFRGVPVALGVRQDTPAYMRRRHPRRRTLHLAGDILDEAWRALARRRPTVVVGDGLAARYRSARALERIVVSLVREGDIREAQESDAGPDADGEVRVLSVGRLESEKNPLLLADVLARLGPRWRLVVCGEGELAGALAARARARGVDARLEMRGYVPYDDGLVELYRGCHAFLHVSWTEGVPQVLFEAFAAGVPVVATDVGGVRAATGDAALLVPPGDAAAAARALERAVGDAELRAALVRAGRERVRAHTLEAEARRTARFLRAAFDPAGPDQLRPSLRASRESAGHAGEAQSRRTRGEALRRKCRSSSSW